MINIFTLNIILYTFYSSILIVQAPGTTVSYICSAYCNTNTCSAGLTSSISDCGGSSNCRSTFINNSSNCGIDRTIYSVVF